MEKKECAVVGPLNSDSKERKSEKGGGKNLEQAGIAYSRRGILSYAYIVSRKVTKKRLRKKATGVAGALREFHLGFTRGSK